MPNHCAALISVVALMSACSTSGSGIAGAADSDAYVAAADENFFDVVTSAKATTRVVALNGVATGASRFNRGAGMVPAGPVMVLLRFWGENKRMGLPIGSPAGKVETFGCVTFEARAKRSYEISTIVMDAGYVVSVTDLTEEPKRNVYRIELPFDSTATTENCRLPSS